MLLLVSSLLFLLHQCWLYKKPTAKVLVTFVLGNKNCKRAWRFPLETLPTTVCIDFSFLNLRCTTTNNNFFYSSPIFFSFEIHPQIHTSLLVGLHSLFDSDICICNLDFMLSCCNLIFLFLFF